MTFPWIVAAVAAVGLAVLGLLYWAWEPGLSVRDGRHDLGANGIWLQHGWLGDDTWFARNGRDPKAFRDPATIRALTERLRGQGIRYLYPHLAPASPQGPIAPLDDLQTQRFLDQCEGLQVLPWVGGVLGRHVVLHSPAWRAGFRASIQALLQRHPRLAGIHINIEPLPSGNRHFLGLLEELRRELPPGKILSVAAFPPPLVWQPGPDSHWDRGYYQEVAARADQLVVMLYDSATPLEKVYQRLMARWNTEVLNWASATQVLLGVPAYADEGVLYHSPRVENLHNALLGIHRGLDTFAKAMSAFSVGPPCCEGQPRRWG